MNDGPQFPRHTTTNGFVVFYRGGEISPGKFLSPTSTTVLLLIRGYFIVSMTPT